MEAINTKHGKKLTKMFILTTLNKIIQQRQQLNDYEGREDYERCSDIYDSLVFNCEILINSDLSEFDQKFVEDMKKVINYYGFLPNFRTREI